MASPSLSQILKGSSGQLYQTSEEELQNKTKDRGLVASPITPAGASGLGVNPDVAKMAGTGAQKAPALREAIQGGVGESQDLATTVRRQQSPAKPPVDAQAKLAEAQKLKGLGSLDTRVDELKDRLTSNLTAGTTTLFDPLRAGQNPALVSALTKLNVNPNDQQAWLEANKALGRGQGNLATLEELKATYGGNVGQQATAAANSALTTATVNSLGPQAIQSMGFTDINDLATTLGIPADRIANMPLNQLTQAAQAKLQQDYNQVPQLQQVTNDPFAGPAARAEARKQLQGLGASGIRSAETDMDKLADDIANSLNVSFGGKEISLDQALSDDTVGSFIEQYMDATPEEQAKLKQQEPSLTGFVDKYRGAFNQAAAQAASGEKQFSETQQKILAQTDLGGGVTLSKNIMDKIYPGWDSLGTKLPDVAAHSKLLSTLKSDNSLSPESKQGIVSLLDKTAKSNPQLLQDLIDTPVSNLKALGLDKPGPKLDEFNHKVSVLNNIKNLTAKSTPDQVAGIFGFGSATELERTLKEADLMERSGLFGKEDSGLTNIRKYLIRGLDGKLDPKATASHLQRQLPRETAGALDAWSNAPDSSRGKLGTYLTQNNETYNVVKPALVNGKITAQSYNDKLANVINSDNFTKYPDLMSTLKDPAAKQALVDDLTAERNWGQPLSTLKVSLKQGKADLRQAQRVQDEIEDEARAARDSGNKDLEAALDKEWMSLRDLISGNAAKATLAQNKGIQETNAAKQKTIPPKATPTVGTTNITSVDDVNNLPIKEGPAPEGSLRVNSDGTLTDAKGRNYEKTADGFLKFKSFTNQLAPNQETGFGFTNR